MNVDDETRKALHEIRNAIHLMQLESTRTNGEVKASMVELKADTKGMNEKMQQMVTKPEFLPVKLICYGMTAMILTSTFTAILALIYVK